MTRELWIEKSTYRSFKDLPESIQEKLRDKLHDIAATPQVSSHRNVRILEGPKQSVYRLRLGDYRVVFTTEKGELRVHKVGKRSSVYDKVNSVYEAVS
jgi:mRNA interferase RelE/StbE